MVEIKVDIEKKVNQLSNILNKYKNYEELMREHYRELQRDIQDFLKDVENARNTGRLLRIGIVGQVKVGKSSFLNALIFEGNGVLPKAATPMTASLTVIKYAPKVKAEIEFYDAEEWNTILNMAKEFERIYNETKKDLEEKMQKEVESGGLFGRSNNYKRKVQTADILATAGIPEEYKASYELVSMVRKSGLLVEKYLGKKETIENVSNVEDLMELLKDYVGTDGKFTPIVRNSCVYYDDPILKDIEIVDTPGINDPVISRGRRTKKYLGQCDVVFVLSYCGQFIDTADIELLAQNLPAKGIKNIVLIGSQLDSAMLQEYKKYKNITQLLDNLEIRLEKYVEDTFRNLQERCEGDREKEIIKELNKSLPPIFISAMAYNISKHYDDLDNEEKHFLNLYNNMYQGLVFDEDLLIELSNMELVFEKLQEQKLKKEEILNSRLENLVDGIEDRFHTKLQAIKKELQNKLNRIEKEDLESLYKKEKEITKRLNKGKNEIEICFENLILKIKQEFSLLLTDIKQVSRHFSNVNVKSESYTETYTVSVSKWYKPWTWGKKETRSRTITYRYANIYESIEQIEEFVYESEKRLKEVIIDIVDMPKFKAEIKKATLSVFNLGDENFDVQDVIIPVKRVINKITIPEIEFEEQNYSDIIANQFSSDRVKESDIERLREVQREVIRKVVEDIKIAVDKKTKEIVASLENTQKEYIDNVLNDIRKEINNLREYIKNKENSIKSHKELISKIEEDLKLMGVNGNDV
ncbi:Dynamin family protein [Caminicella sporogenes DSM 14501]|uniref:Dynamin family protein n=1 Tax=Caminicella sporogenes DSM 14501 TaxID=1121266 RepID=A0A1M6REK7_9FIRM|nr:dynamin family protein [Caminicella sporogenes]RKD25210.1 hypothetical protein BET04_03040 [Caminicella sporogenes]SHK30787.1 Dynamin family protein [Caminicella sporogenes DSM 14501]